MAQKKVFIVGASSGIGFEVARLYIERGHRVVVCARRVELLQQLVGLAPERCQARRIDVTAAGADKLVVEALDSLGGIDTYVHVAGVGWQNPHLETDKDQKTIDTNVCGFLRLVTAVYKYMSEHGGGHVAVVSSIAGTKGLGVAASYSASKAFQNCYVEALAQLARMQKRGVTFTDIRPGFVATDFLAGAEFPMLMEKQRVARQIVRAIDRKKEVAVIDGRWRLLTWAWRLVPRRLWIRLKIGSND